VADGCDEPEEAQVMRAGTRTLTIARRAATVAVTIVAALTFTAGCGADKPADGNGATGTTGAGPSGTDQAATPGATGAGGTGGADGGTGGGPTGTKPCAVLTSQEASQALGASVKTTVDSDTECLYEAGANAVMFSVTTEPYDQATIDDLAMLAPAVQKLDGVGDAAFKVSLGTDTQFHVWTKGKYVALIVTKESGDTETPGRQLLDKVLSRL
jgi:hypothetical protein